MHKIYTTTHIQELLYLPLCLLLRVSIGFQEKELEIRRQIQRFQIGAHVAQLALQLLNGKKWIKLCSWLNSDVYSRALGSANASLPSHWICQRDDDAARVQCSPRHFWVEVVH